MFLIPRLRRWEEETEVQGYTVSSSLHEVLSQAITRLKVWVCQLDGSSEVLRCSRCDFFFLKTGFYHVVLDDLELTM